MSDNKEQKIRERAYEIWEYRIENNLFGDTLSDWLRAEVEIENCWEVH